MKKIRKFIKRIIKEGKRKLRRYFTVPVHTKARYHLFGVFVAAFSITLTVILGGYEVYKKVFALNESSFSMPQQVAFNRGEENGLAGYQNNNGLVAVFSDEIRLATSSAKWWNGAYLYKKPITLKNLASQPIATATAQIIVNTKELYDAGKLQNDCDDLEVVFIATQSGSLREKLNRSYILPSGVSDCANSTATIVSFPLRETVWQNGGIDSNYELYYGNPSASSPNTSKGFDLIRSDGSTVSATLVCPFNGTTTCLNQQGTVNPTTATGAIRYSGGKGSALSFDGKDDYVDLGNNIDNVFTGNFTIEAWVKLPVLYSWFTILGRTGWPNNIWFQINESCVQMNMEGIVHYYIFSGCGVQPNTWHHVVVSYAPNGGQSNANIFIDGVLRRSLTLTGIPGNPLSSLRIGGTNYYARGFIDELRISNIVRYTSNFTPQTTPFEPDEYTVLLLHFDENGDDPRNSGKAIDSSGRGNHGTIYGAKYVSGLVGVDSSDNDTGVLSIQPYAGHQGVFIEEGTTNLIINPSFENATAYNKFWTLPYFNYATASATFTPNMAKRNSAGPFAAGVMISGDLANGQGKTDDVISIDRGTQIAGNFYQNFDPSQGSVILWWTPEFSYNASSGSGLHYLWYISSNYYLAYDYANDRFELKIGGQAMTVSANILAGTTYKLTARWDGKNKLDGTNYASLTIDNSTTFGIATQPTTEAPASTIYIGTNGTTGGASGIIEGLTVYRRPLFDNETTSGIDVGNGDEVNGSSSDPTLTTGSWDIVFDLPTNASTGQLTSGTGNAWSHPHSSNLLYTNTTNTGGFMMNGNYTADGWSNVGTPTSVSTLATNEKIYAGGYKFTTDEAGEGIKYTVSSQPQGRDYVVRAIAHSDGTSIPKIQIWDTVNNHEITQMTATSSASTQTKPEVFLFTFELPYVSRYGGQPGYEWVNSDSNAFEVRLLNNSSSESTVYWHQVEVYQNLIDNPSMEVGSGDPWIPAGWSNNNQNLTAGESTHSIVNHSGNKSLQLIEVENGDGVKFSLTQSGFLAYGTWLKVSSNVLGIGSGSHIFRQTSSWQGLLFLSSNSMWEHVKGVARADGFTSNIDLRGASGDPSSGYGDDTYIINLNSVYLGVAPANQSNSTETTGLRVDGADTLTQPITGWTTASGSAKFKFTPRHSFDVADKFGFTNPVIASASASTNNDYLKLYKQSSSVLRLEGKFNGNVITTDWNSPTLNAGITYNIEMGYSQNYGIWLTVDGVERARNPSGVVPFGNIPTIMYFGSDGQGSNQYDGTYTSFVSLLPEQNTTAPYYKFGSKSVKLTGFDREDLYTIAATPSATAVHTLSAYVYDGTSGNIGGTVDSSVAQLASSSAVLSTSYTDMGGGWWRLTASPNLNAGTHYLGVQVKPGKTVYVDGVQLEQKAYATTYADGSLGSGYSWSGGENESVGGRSGSSIVYSSIHANNNKGTLSFWAKPQSFNWNQDFLPGFTHNLVGIGIQNGTGNNNLKLYWTDLDNGDPTKITFIPVAQGIWKSRISATWSHLPSSKTWKHIAINWKFNSENSSDYYKLFIDGVKIGEVVNQNISMGNFDEGINVGNNSIFTISDIRIFNQALSENQVSQIYLQGLQTHQSGGETDDRYESGTYTYISPVIDLSANGAWGTTPWSIIDQLNNGTISYFTRTSPDNLNWSSWEAVSGNNIASPPRRYFQWKAEMSPNSELNQSPVIKGLTLTYVEDTTPPQNPQQAALGYTDSASSSATLVSGTWYNYPKPKFTWEAGEDVAASGQSASGIDTYRLLLTTDANATPSANLGDNCYLETQSNQREFIVGSNPASCSLEDGVYYLRLQTKDNSGNISDPVTMFTYKYDGSIPNAPSSVATTNVGYQAVNSFTFFWPAATDNGPSGLKGYEYRTGAPDSTWQFTTATSVSDIQAYQEGQNFFYVRSVDNAGNYSGETTSNVAAGTFYYNQSAPTAPRNVKITPETSATNPASNNVFTVTWDKPENYSGEIAKYYYCVNCTPSATTMTETTPSETINRKLENVALATQQGKNTFYIVAEDNNINTSTGHGNRNFEAYASVDFYASTVAPGAPTALTISDASDKQNSLWRLTLVWKAPTTGGTPAKYDIYRSLDNSTFNFVGSVTSTAYTDTDLEYNKTYYYKVKALDNAGSSSIFSNTVSLAPVGKYYDPPSAGGVPSASCGSTTCTISWTTSRATYGTVEYGKTTSYGSAASESNATKDHSIKISGLAPGTTYHFRVMALDEASLVGYDRSQAYSSDYTFTTLNTASISEITVSDITLNSAIISWHTSSLSTSKVEYGETTDYGSIVEVSNVASESAHMVKLSNLKHSTKYHFRVRGTTVDGEDIFSEDNSFSTLVFPKISAVVFNTEQDEGGTSVVLAWATNVKTTAEVEYQGAILDQAQSSNLKTQNWKIEDLQKLSPTELARVPIVPKGKAQTVYNLKFDTKHIQRISGLDDGTIYVFTIRGRDEYGNQLVSDPIRYVTGSDTKPPAIYNQIIETPISGVGTEAKAQIIVSWETDEPSIGQVIWGQGTGSEYPFASEKESSLTTKHTIILRDLSPNTAYHLKILSHDKNKNKAESQDTVVVTPSAQQAAFDIILKNLEDIFGFLKL